MSRLRFERTEWLTLLLITSIATLLRSEETTIPQLVKRIKPAIVTIVTYDGHGALLTQGSGFFINPGHIVSSRHVLLAARRAEATAPDGSIYPIRGVVAEDQEGDLILLEVDIPTQTVQPLSVVKTLPQEGEKVIVVGSLLGLAQSLSDGIVSAIREIPHLGRVIQITAPVSPGSSGSPIINLNGEVIGVAAAALEGQSLNFAIPGDRILALTPEPRRPLAEWAAGTAAEPAELVGKAFASLWSGDYAHAEAYFERMVAQQPHRAEVWSLLGVCKANRGHDQEAIHDFEEAIRLEPEFIEAHANLCTAYLRQSRYQESLKACTQALRLRPGYAEAYSNLAAVYVSLGRHQEAVDAATQAIQSKPDLAEAYSKLGGAYDGLGRAQDAIDAYKQALHLKPEYAEASLGLGTTYDRLGRYDEAIEAFQRAIQIDPDSADAHSNLGAVYARRGRYQEAVDAFRQATRLKPDFVEAQANLAVAYFMLERWPEAIGAYQQAIRLKPNAAGLHYDLGMAYLAIGDRASARKEYEVLQALDPQLAGQLVTELQR